MKRGDMERGNDLRARSKTDSIANSGGPTTASSNLKETVTGPGVGIVTIYNGFCRFNPSTSRGRYIFVSQTLLLSFTPLLILLIQNSFSFNDMMLTGEKNLEQSKLVDEVASLTIFITAIQRERNSVAIGLFSSKRSGIKSNFTEDFRKTTSTIGKVTWKKFGPQKLFDTKLRFQIRLDDFREYLIRSIDDITVDETIIEEVLFFYNMVTNTMLDFLATEIGKASSSTNWRLIMTSFNTIKIIESAGIGLVYGLRYYGNGVLKEMEMILYVQHHALLWEYYRKAKEIVLGDITEMIDKLYKGQSFSKLKAGSLPILENLPMEADYKKGIIFFEECRKFISEALELLAVLRGKIQAERHAQLYSLKLANVWSIVILTLILLISPVLALLAKNVIHTFQMFAQSLDNTAKALRRQQKKRNRLVHKMLPKSIVLDLKNDRPVNITFDSATVFVATIVDFATIVVTCNAIESVQFLNNLLNVVDICMEDSDVYRVENFADNFLIASGVPATNGDRHAIEACSMALKLVEASNVVIRPDKRPQTIEVKLGIHTGGVHAGVVGSNITKYTVFGETVNTAAKLMRHSLPSKIQISEETKFFLDVVGGFKTEERGVIEVEGKGPLQTFWLTGKKSDK